MMNGIVKWFSPGKGFGLITAENGTDVIAHFSQINKRGYKTLKQGESVTFDFANGQTRTHAENITTV